MTWMIVLAAVVGMGALVAVPFVLKATKPKPVPTWVTRQGVEVFAGALNVDAERIEDAIGVAVGWWCAHAPGETSQIKRYVGECELHLVAEPYIYAGRQVGGHTQGRIVTAWIGDNLAAVRHEFSHVCLRAMGYDPRGEQHHVVMKEKACPF
jgi:hypothetical protein